MLGISPLGWFFIILYSITIIALMIYFCAESDDGCLGKILNFMTVKLPGFISKVLHFIIGNRAATKVEACGGTCLNYVLYKRNPLLQMFYLLVVLGAYSLVVYSGYPKIPCHYLPYWHKYTAAIAVSFCIYLWWLACTVSPGIITEETLFKYENNYHYHQYVYPAGRICQTAGIVKPARSKFCRFMNANVARFDHFCPWINQAVGMENYRYFITFLGAHCLLLTYGALGMFALLASEVVERDLLNAQFYSASQGKAIPATKTVVIQYLIYENWGAFAVCLLCTVMAVVLGGFTVYHLYLIARNTTTNESYKWSDLRHAYSQYEAKRIEHIKAIALRNELKELQNEKDSHTCNEEEEKEEENEFLPKEEFPENIYHQGILLNFYEVFYPYSLRTPPVNVLVNDNKQDENNDMKKKKNKKNQQKGEQNGIKNEKKKTQNNKTNKNHKNIGGAKTKSN